MKRILLFLSFLTSIAALTVWANVSATINVDNAANVKVAYGVSGEGDEIILQNGSNPVSLDDSQQPLYVGARNGATITEIKVDGTPSMALRDNECRLGIYEGMVIDITTSAPSSDATVAFSLNNPGSVKISFGDIVTTETVSQTVEAGTTFTISPLPGYSIDNVSSLHGHPTNNNDGSWSVQADQDDTIYISTSVTGVSFNINIDNVNNVAVSLGMGSDEYSLTWLINGDNKVVTTSDYMPLNLVATNGATITKVTNNGIEANMSGDSNYHLAFAEGDNIVVATQGAVSSTGIVIKADNAARILVKQANGYGDALSLTDGENPFEITDIDNPLKISATEGNEITAVTYNGEARTPSNDGSYIVKVEAGSVLAVTSREIPQDITVGFAITPADNYRLVSVAIDGIPLSLTAASSSHTVKAGAVATISCRAGYVITDLDCGDNNYDQTDGVYTVTLNNPATISMAVEEMQARDGYAVVTFDVNKSTIYIEEYDGDQYVRSLDSSKAYEIEIGHIVRIYTYTRTTFFNEVSVNGSAVQPVEGNEKSFEVTIEGKSMIKVDAYSKVEVVTYDTNDPENHSKIGSLYVKDGDGQVTSYLANVGETVEFVAAPADGFVLDYIQCVYPGSDEQYTSAYTVTEADLANSMVIFQGVFIEDRENPSFVIRGERVYVQTDEGVVETGEVKVVENGVERMETIAYEGAEVTLVAYPAQGYRFKRFMLWSDEEVTLSNPYVVDGTHADETRVISISAEFVTGSDAVEDISADAGLEYDSANGILSSALEMNVYDINGRLLITSKAGSLDLSTLDSGIYIAISGNQVRKFNKK